MTTKQIPSWLIAQKKIMPYLRAPLDLDQASAALGYSRSDLQPLLDKYGVQKENDLLVAHSVDPSIPTQVYMVVDSETNMDFVQVPHLQEWGVTKDEAWELAYSNLMESPNNKRLSKMDDGRGNIWACCYGTMDGYDATRILLPPVRAFLCAVLKVEWCLIGIPNRDFLIAFNPQLGSIEFMQQQIRKDFRSKDHPITDALFIADQEGNLILPEK